jgi:hypothetical protein
MARNTQRKANGSEWIANWTAANVSITSTTAGTAPVALGSLDGKAFLQMSFSGATAGVTATWHLCLVDSEILDNDGNPSIARCVEFTTTANTRRTDHDGAGGEYFHEDKIIDIDGRGGTEAGGGSYLGWFLVLAALSDTGDVQLRGIHSTKAPSSR